MGLSSHKSATSSGQKPSSSNRPNIPTTDNWSSKPKPAPVVDPSMRWIPMFRFFPFGPCPFVQYWPSYGIAPPPTALVDRIFKLMGHLSKVGGGVVSRGGAGASRHMVIFCSDSGNQRTLRQTIEKPYWSQFPTLQWMAFHTEIKEHIKGWNRSRE